MIHIKWPSKKFAPHKFQWIARKTSRETCPFVRDADWFPTIHSVIANTSWRSRSHKLSAALNFHRHQIKISPVSTTKDMFLHIPDYKFCQPLEWKGANVFFSVPSSFDSKKLTWKFRFIFYFRIFFSRSSLYFRYSNTL